MKDLLSRLIAYAFFGSFYLVGPLCLLVALGAAMQRAALLYSGLRAEGTVIAQQPVGSRRVTYAPVFQFTASDGRVYVVNSDVSGRKSAFRYGARVPVLYRADHPESARIDAFAPLFTFPLRVGVVGGAFSFIPALVWANWKRKRRTSGEASGRDSAGIESDRPSAGFRWALGALLAGAGVILMAVGSGVVPPYSSSLESRVIAFGMGVLLTACGTLIGQWVAVGTRLYHALGGTAITSMACLFGWVSLYGEASGFSGSVGMGGVALASSGSATPARIAFGLASIVFGLGSLLAWRQVFRSSRRDATQDA